MFSLICTFLRKRSISCVTTEPGLPHTFSQLQRMWKNFKTEPAMSLHFPPCPHPTFVSCFGVNLGDLGRLRGRLWPNEKTDIKRWGAGWLPRGAPPSVGPHLPLTASEAALAPHAQPSWTWLPSTALFVVSPLWTGSVSCPHPCLHSS